MAQRASLTALSVALYVAWFVSFATGIEARGDGSGGMRQLAAVAASPTSQPAQLAVERDPFAPDDVALAGNGATTGPAFDVPDVREIRVSDFTGTRDPRSPSSGYTLKATIIGSNPVAYVESGTGMLIGRVGDAVAGRTIVRIDLGGVDFSDGTRLLLSDSRPPIAAPARRQRADPSQELEALRKVLSRERSHSIAPVSAEPPKTQVAPTASPTFPPPGPLPTIVPDFLPVGVSPTSDPNGPTPYPLPPPRPNF